MSSCGACVCVCVCVCVCLAVGPDGCSAMQCAPCAFHETVPVPAVQLDNRLEPVSSGRRGCDKVRETLCITRANSRILCRCNACNASIDTYSTSSVLCWRAATSRMLMKSMSPPPDTHSPDEAIATTHAPSAPIIVRSTRPLGYKARQDHGPVHLLLCELVGRPQFRNCGSKLWFSQNQDHKKFTNRLLGLALGRS